MNLLTAGRKALLERLSTITQQNGYRTNAGLNVVSGWFNEVVEARNHGWPLMVLQKSTDQPPLSRAAGLKMLAGYGVMAGVQAGLDDYEEALEDLELDILECLMPTEGVPLAWTPRAIPQITIGPAAQVPPGDGLMAATLQVPVYLHTFIESPIRDH